MANNSESIFTLLTSAQKVSKWWNCSWNQHLKPKGQEHQKVSPNVPMETQRIILSFVKKIYSSCEAKHFRDNGASAFEMIVPLFFQEQTFASKTTIIGRYASSTVYRLPGWTPACGFGISLAKAVHQKLVSDAYRVIYLLVMYNLKTDERSIQNSFYGAVEGMPACEIRREDAKDFYTRIKRLLLCELGSRFNAVIKNCVEMGMPKVYAVTAISNVFKRAATKDMHNYSIISQGILAAEMKAKQNTETSTISHILQSSRVCLNMPGSVFCPSASENWITLHTQLPPSATTIELIIPNLPSTKKNTFCILSSFQYVVQFAIATEMSTRSFARYQIGIVDENAVCSTIDSQLKRLISMHTGRIMFTNMPRILNSKTKHTIAPTPRSKEMYRKRTLDLLATTSERPTNGVFGIGGNDLLSMIMTPGCKLIKEAAIQSIESLVSKLSSQSILRSTPGAELYHIVTLILTHHARNRDEKNTFDEQLQSNHSEICPRKQHTKVVQRRLMQLCARTLFAIQKLHKEPHSKKAWNKAVNERTGKKTIVLDLFRAMYACLPYSRTNLLFHSLTCPRATYAIVVARYVANTQKNKSNGLFYLPEEIWSLIQFWYGVDNIQKEMKHFIAIK